MKNFLIANRAGGEGAQLIQVPDEQPVVTSYNADPLSKAVKSEIDALVSTPLGLTGGGPGRMGEATITPGSYSAGAKSQPISIFGHELKRIAPPIVLQNAFEHALANTLSGLFSDGPVLGNDVYRTKAAVEAALADPLASDNAGALKGTTVYRPGLGNTKVGPGVIGRLAQYSDEVIIAYANPGTKPEDFTVRKASELPAPPPGLEHLPPELLAKVSITGSPEPIMISYLQASDVLLEQLATIGKKGINIVAHSQGGDDAVKGRARLEQAGMPDVVRKLYTLATPFEGSLVSSDPFAAAMHLPHLQATEAAAALNPGDMTEQMVSVLARTMVDVSFVAQIDHHRQGYGETRGVFKATHALLAGGSHVAGDTYPDLRHLKALGLSREEAEARGDGMVQTASQLHGKRIAELPGISLDHASVAEVPQVIDAIVLAAQ